MHNVTSCRYEFPEMGMTYSAWSKAELSNPRHANHYDVAVNSTMV